MEIQKNFDLKNLNSFNISAKTKYFYSFSSIKELQNIIEHNKVLKEKTIILGGGSNILLTKDFDGLIIKNEIKGIDIKSESERHVNIEVGAGENWHNFVKWSVTNNLSGIENLALIPGSVGATPIQNIGAYGMEVKNTIKKVYCLDIETQTEKVLTNKECDFKYRDSIFKNKFKNKFVITKVVYCLNKEHANNSNYGAINEELKELKMEPSLTSIFKAVISIRNKKLPDPKKLGNSGSFFKNPIIENEKFQKLKKSYPNIVGYPIKNGDIKIAAGWLIEKAGWKGYTEGSAGVHKKQALVLVNYGQATGKDILNLSFKIKDSVKEKFDIEITPEVNII